MEIINECHAKAFELSTKTGGRRETTLGQLPAFRSAACS